MEHCCGLTSSYLEVSTRILAEYKIYRGNYVSKQSQLVVDIVSTSVASSRFFSPVESESQLSTKKLSACVIYVHSLFIYVYAIYLFVTGKTLEIAYPSQDFGFGNLILSISNLKEGNLVKCTRFSRTIN